MKNISGIGITLAMAVSLTACGNAEQAAETKKKAAEEQQQEELKKQQSTSLSGSYKGEKPDVAFGFNFKQIDENNANISVNHVKLPDASRTALAEAVAKKQGDIWVFTLENTFGDDRVRGELSFNGNTATYTISAIKETNVDWGIFPGTYVVQKE